MATLSQSPSSRDKSNVEPKASVKASKLALSLYKMQRKFPINLLSSLPLVATASEQPAKVTLNVPYLDGCSA